MATSVKIELTVTETESHETNSYNKSFRQFKMRLTDREREWIQSCIDPIDQASFKNIHKFQNHYLQIEGVYKYELFQHKKKLTISKLKMNESFEVEQHDSSPENDLLKIINLIKK